MPCKSGSPHAVLSADVAADDVGAPAFAGLVGACPVTVTMLCATIAMVMAAARSIVRSNRCVIPFLLTLAGAPRAHVAGSGAAQTRIPMGRARMRIVYPFGDG